MRVCVCVCVCVCFQQIFFLQFFFLFFRQVLPIVKRDFNGPQVSFEDILLPKFWSTYFTRPFSMLRIQGLLWSLLSTSLLKWPAYLRLRWTIISHLSGSLDFSQMNLFGKCYYRLTFDIFVQLTNHIDEKVFWYLLCISSKFLRCTGGGEKTIAHNTQQI